LKKKAIKAVRSFKLKEIKQGVQYLTEDKLKDGWPKFSTLSHKKAIRTLE
jgi:hypothetical protein